MEVRGLDKLQVVLFTIQRLYFAHVTPKSASPGTTAYVNTAEGIAEVTIPTEDFTKIIPLEFS